MHATTRIFGDQLEVKCYPCEGNYRGTAALELLLDNGEWTLYGLTPETMEALGTAILNHARDFRQQLNGEPVERFAGSDPFA